MRRPLFPLLLLIAFATAAAYPQNNQRAANGSQTIAHVTFVSVHSYAKDKLLAASGLKIGAPLTDESLRDAANRLAATGAFSDVRYKYNGGDVEFTLPEQNDLVPCRFENLVWFTQPEIDAGLAARVPLYNGSVPGTGNLADSVSRALESMLQEKGLQGAEVEALPLTEMGDKGKMLGMLFSVLKPETKVGQVNFSGVSAGELPTMQKGVEPLLGGDYRHSFVSDFMQSNLIPLYRRDGYLKAAIGAPEGKLASATEIGATVDVAVSVTQGDQFHIGDIRWAGSEVIPQKDAGKLLRLKPDDVANQDLLRASVENFAAAYKAKGYMKAHLSAVPTMDAEKPVVSYDINATPGKQYHMGNVSVRGLDAASVDTAQKRWKLKTGDVYDPGYFRNYLAHNLQGLNLQGMQVTFQESLHDDPETVDVIVEFRRAKNAK